MKFSILLVVAAALAAAACRFPAPAGDALGKNAASRGPSGSPGHAHEHDAGSNPRPRDDVGDDASGGGGDAVDPDDPVDAGADLVDAGAVDIDAGTCDGVVDAGGDVVVDAGGDVVDAGVDVVDAGTDGVVDAGAVGTGPRPVFVVALENHRADQIYGSAEAPYLNQLLTQGARAEAYQDDLPSLPSEPHYVWMEAGTNAFADHTFTNDDDPSSANSTNSAAHLVNQLEQAGVTWRSYQEGLDDHTGACPTHSAGFYQAKHDPFVFFTDVTSSSSSRCADHHRAESALAGDIARGDVASYTFVTPDQCHDMHGQAGCSGSPIGAADTWLAREVPPMLAYAAAHDGTVLIVFDEPEGVASLPFIALGPRAKPGYRGTVRYTHSSLVKSLEEIFGVPLLSTVADANDFADLFAPGTFPAAATQG